MKEHIDTIPVNDAFSSEDECPFCYLERMAEQRTIRYVLGPAASYMEPGVRGSTDIMGFCREHYKKMYDYGNALGNALIMQTYMARLIREFEEEAAQFKTPAKRPLLGGKKKSSDTENSMLDWATEKTATCYICRRNAENMHRYYLTFFVMLKEPEFRKRVEEGKGFCMRHYVQLRENARERLPNAQRVWFYETVVKTMGENLLRVKEDLDWFIGMFDYRNAGRDWKNARDAVSRTMQKLQGSYPAEPPYKEKK